MSSYITGLANTAFNPQTMASGGGSSWLDVLGKGIGTAANTASNFLGSDAGKNLTGLAGLGLNYYQGQQTQDAANTAAANQYDLQNRYYNLAKAELDAQNEQQDEAQDAFAQGFASSGLAKPKVSPYASLGLAGTGTVV